MTLQEQIELKKATRIHVADLMERLEMKESAKAIQNVLTNDVMALGLIKLLLSFSAMNYIACKHEKKPDNEDTQVYLDAAISIAFQWKAMKRIKAKNEP